jgi:hypothetical protein
MKYYNVRMFVTELENTYVNTINENMDLKGRDASIFVHQCYINIFRSGTPKNAERVQQEPLPPLLEH